MALAPLNESSNFTIRYKEDTVKNFFFEGTDIKNIKKPIVIIVPDPFVKNG